jgi:NAD(P)-dependent dehydrogenase (short-subunit alcohol dehydrogenase family)
MDGITMRLPTSCRIVITGAASGFGRALAVELSRRRAHLVLSDVDVPGTEETARLAASAGAASTRVVRCDVTALADVQALAAACEGPIDLVVNNAGVASAGLVGVLPMSDWRWTLDVDLFGVIHGCHVFVPKLRAQKRGHVLNVASAAGIASTAKMGAYNVAKAGVIALSETLAAELSGSGVGVTVVCPTFFKTNIARSGHFADPFARLQAIRLVENGKRAEDVARATIASVERDELYCLPMADARWLWRLKRLAPRQFRSIVTRVSEWSERRASRVRA